MTDTAFGTASEALGQQSAPQTVTLSSDTRRFVKISSPLTGFGQYDLYATGMAELYLKTVREQIGPVAYDQFRDRLETAPREIVETPTLLEIARAVTYLWYTGAWPCLAKATHAALRRQMANEEFVVSPSSYTEGLVWRTFHGHPVGAKAPGFATWSYRPPSVPTVKQILEELALDAEAFPTPFIEEVTVSGIKPSMLPGLAPERSVAPSTQPRAEEPQARKPEAGAPDGVTRQVRS